MKKENIFKFVGIYDLMKTAQMFLLNAENLHCFSFSLCIAGFFFCCGHSKQSYTSRNSWKQDEVIKFTMPNLKRWVSSWYEFEASIKCGERANEIKTGSTERLVTHLHNLRSFRNSFYVWSEALSTSAAAARKVAQNPKLI